MVRTLAMTRALVPWLLLAVVAAAEEPKPKPDLSCKTASDCAVTHHTDACCVVCGWTPGAKGYVTALDAWCNANQNPRCPPYDCPPMDPAVACVKGKCRLKAK